MRCAADCIHDHIAGGKGTASGSRRAVRFGGPSLDRNERLKFTPAAHPRVRFRRCGREHVVIFNPAGDLLRLSSWISRSAATALVSSPWWPHTTRRPSPFATTRSDEGALPPAGVRDLGIAAAELLARAARSSFRDLCAAVRACGERAAPAVSALEPPIYVPLCVRVREVARFRFTAARRSRGASQLAPLADEQVDVFPSRSLSSPPAVYEVGDEDGSESRRPRPGAIRRRDLAGLTVALARRRRAVHGSRCSFSSVASAAAVGAG